MRSLQTLIVSLLLSVVVVGSTPIKSAHPNTGLHFLKAMVDYIVHTEGHESRIIFKDDNSLPAYQKNLEEELLSEYQDDEDRYVRRIQRRPLSQRKRQFPKRRPTRT